MNPIRLLRRIPVVGTVIDWLEILGVLLPGDRSAPDARRAQVPDLDMKCPRCRKALCSCSTGG